MSLLLASKYVVPSHIHLGAFSGICIISFSNLVNVTWDDERPFNQKFGTLLITGDFHSKFKFGYVLPFLFLYFLISFLHRHIVDVLLGILS